ncbi:fructose-bisphosphatase class III, partial [Clostridioides difficile]
GKCSSLFGKDDMTTFERYFIAEKETHKENKNPYFKLRENEMADRIRIGGGTRFSPVFEYANNKKINLLVYFTDGKGENKLQVIP